MTASVQINDYKGFLPPSHHCFVKTGHHIEIGELYCVHGIFNHRKRVPNQKQIAVWIEHMRHWRRASCQTRNFRLPFKRLKMPDARGLYHDACYCHGMVHDPA